MKILNAPKDWHELVKNSWRYLISTKECFEKYYPKINRGPKSVTIKEGEEYE